MPYTTGIQVLEFLILFIFFLIQIHSSGSQSLQGNMRCFRPVYKLGEQSSAIENSLND